tara:strand:- start:1126 stop:1620 length:495 start_codon:yes stop_codon:yes gene_type:complete
METSPLTSRRTSPFAGDGILRQTMGSHIMDTVHAPQPQSAPSSPCQLRMKRAAVESGYAITFSWGTIAGRQPYNFDTDGYIGTITIPDDSAFHFFYARATYDSATGLWTDARIVEAAVDVDNTNTLHYTLLGSAKVVDDVLRITAPVCGPIVPEVCQLASEISP